ncbi:MAG: DUF3891 family protein [Planctomycetales bacterium]|nr:DUF3891 family protein [Planctomycetales bacterium]
MIRRDATLADGSPAWLLVSQVEHARISGELAAAALPELLLGLGGDEAAQAAAQTSEFAAIRKQMLAAIRRHDDGWRGWIEDPQLDPEHGRPYSFTEMPAGDALRIWSGSIAAAAEEGPLAAWMVGGHFRRLLDHSETLGHQPLADLWRATQDRARDLYLDEWKFAAPRTHTDAVAEHALEALWIFDAISLWFCCGCPGGDAAAPTEEAFACGPFHIGAGTTLETTLRLAPPTGGHGAAIDDPWIFTPPAIELQTPAMLVPAKRYQSTAELVAAYEPTTLRWTLRRQSH